MVPLAIAGVLARSGRRFRDPPRGAHPGHGVGSVSDRGHRRRRPSARSCAALASRVRAATERLRRRRGSEGLRAAAAREVRRSPVRRRATGPGFPGSGATPACGPPVWLPTRPALADAVDASGPYIPPDEAIQALLASAAFPVAFGARPVCECRRACGDGQREVTPDQCPGPLPGKSLGGLTCSAYSAARGGQEFKLCRSNFIDGGFLDNAPVGLAIEQAEAFSSPRTLRPLTVLLVDPSIRRPREEPPPAPERAVQGFSDAVQMGNDLVTTAREQRLAEAIVSRHWNLTTRVLLFRTGSALAAYASVVSQLEAGQASVGAEPAAPVWRPSGQERGPARPVHRPLSATPSTRRRRARGLRGNRPGQGRERRWRARRSSPCPAPRLSPDEVLRLAEDLVPFIEGLGSTGRGTGLSLRSTVAAGALDFLADELVPFALQVSAQSALLRMRAACLRSASAVQGLAAHAIEASRPVLADALRELTAAGAPSGIAEPAAQALDLLGTALEHPALSPAGCSPPSRTALTGVSRDEPPGADAGCRAPRRAARRAAATARRLSDAALQLSQDASEIQSDVRGQRRLLLATRFTPSGGGNAGALRRVHGRSAA